MNSWNAVAVAVLSASIIRADVPPLSTLNQAARNAFSESGSSGDAADLETMPYRILLAHALAADGDLSDAIQFLKFDGAVADEENRVIRECVWIARQSKHPLPAPNQFEKLLKASELDSSEQKTAKIRGWMAKIFADQESYKEAAKEIQRISPSDETVKVIVDAYTAMARVQFSRGLPEQALESLQSAVTVGRRHQIISDLTSQLILAGRISTENKPSWIVDAIRAIEKQKREQRQSARSVPDEFQGWLLIGDAWLAQGQIDSAKPAIQKALQVWRTLKPIEDGGKIDIRSVVGRVDVASTGLRLESRLRELRMEPEVTEVSDRARVCFENISGTLQRHVIASLLHVAPGDLELNMRFKLPSEQVLPTRQELNQAIRLLEVSDDSMKALSYFVVAKLSKQIGHHDAVTLCLKSARAIPKSTDDRMNTLRLAGLGKLEIKFGDKQIGLKHIHSLPESFEGNVRSAAMFMAGISYVEADCYAEAHALASELDDFPLLRFELLAALCGAVATRDR